jgi:IS1 family transposase
MTGVARMTVEKLLRDLSVACILYQDKRLRRLACKRIQCDEIWSFVYAKQKNVPIDKHGQFRYGDVWTWVAMDTDTKLAVSWMIGDRGATTAFAFIDDLASRLANRIQLTTDGHRVYLDAVENAFGSEIDYSMLVKLYGADREKEARYTSAECIECREVAVSDRPDPKRISTRYVERQNLRMLICMRGFTRLTNAFSKRVENHAQSVAIHLMYYNFVRIRQSLRVTPAMAAGIEKQVWEVEDIVALLSN